MTVIPFPTRAASFEPAPNRKVLRPMRSALLRLLEPAAAEMELPPLTDLLRALLDLAAGVRHKALVPVALLPLEVALVRRGSSALVSLYHTDASPSVISVDRRVPLRALLDATADALEEQLTAEGETSPIDAATAARLLARAETAPIAVLEDDGRVAVRVRGGADEDPGEERPLAFGFEAAVFPDAGSGDGETGLEHADVHAMLFGGQLWAWVRGRRIPLYKGPILLAAQRMVAACGGFVDAWRAGRPSHVRLRTGTFAVALRAEALGRVSVSFGNGAGDDGLVTVPQLEIPTAVRAVLRLSSELLRALCATDRTQTKNLRVRTLRSEVRRISRALREVTRAGSFTSTDPDRVRAVLTDTAAGDVSAPEPGQRAGSMRVGWSSRWAVSLPSLEAEQTHLAGALVIAVTERGIVAIDRERGQQVWSADGRPALLAISPLGVLSVDAAGVIQHRDVFSGDVLFETRLGRKNGRPSGAPTVTMLSGPSVPPTAILVEAREGVSALDLRTGELRWRFVNKSAGSLKIERAGRMLLVAGDEGSVTALDALTGEVLWRFADDVHAALTPVVVREMAVLVSGEPGRGAHELCGLDLFTGELRYRVELPGPVEVAPIAEGERVLVTMRSGKSSVLVAYSPETGAELWSRADPGVGKGAGLLTVDDRLFVNAPNGRLTALDLASGKTCWQRVLSAAETDDVPRRLDPILRGGALFVPSGTIHVLKPDDGAAIGARTKDGVPADLLPDFFRIDERGWMYVGEESGHLVALAPLPRLALVRTIEG